MPYLMLVAFIQSIENVNRTTMLILPRTRGNSSRQMAFQPRYQPFPAFGLELKHWLFLGLQAVGLQTQTETTPSSLLGAALGTCQTP